MKKICMILVILGILILGFTMNASAGDYDYEGTDDTGDVDIENIDIVSAKIEESGENLIFTVVVDGKIVGDDENISYTVTLKEQGTSDTIRIEFQYYLYARVYDTNPLIIEEIIYDTSEEDTLVLTANKELFSNVTLPWNVTVKAESDDTIDTLTLSAFQSNGEDNGNGDTDTNGSDGQDDSQDGIPGFEVIAVFFSLFIAIILLKRK